MTPQAETPPPSPRAIAPQPSVPAPPSIPVFPGDGRPPVPVKFAGVEAMDFEELRDTVLGLLGRSVEVEPSAVHRPFWYSTVRLAVWDAVSGGKGKLAVKSVRTGRWFMLHTTKGAGSPLESHEAFLQRKSRQQKTRSPSHLRPSRLNPVPLD